MRVLYVSPAAGLGGAERCLLDCIAALRERQGVSLEVLTFADGPMVRTARELGAPDHRRSSARGPRGTGRERIRI